MAAGCWVDLGVERCPCKSPALLPQRSAKQGLAWKLSQFVCHPRLEHAKLTALEVIWSKLREVS